MSAGSSETSTDSGVKVDVKGATNMPAIPTQITVQDDQGRPQDLCQRYLYHVPFQINHNMIFSLLFEGGDFLSFLE